MIGLRNLYRVFQESRKAAKEHATLAVIGTSEQAENLARILGAQRGVKGAEVILSVPEGGGPLTISGKAVEEPDEINEVPTDEGDIREKLVSRIVGALDEDYLVSLGRGYPIFRRAVCEEVIRKNARQNAVIGALPIPGADMPVMTANQGRMVLNIAAIHGEALSVDRAQELIGGAGRRVWFTGVESAVGQVYSARRLGRGGGDRLRRNHSDGPGHDALLRA